MNRSQFYADTKIKLPELELSFRDYVMAENCLKESDRYKQALQYWKQRVQTLPPAPELPMAKNPRSISNPKFTRLHKKMNSDSWLAAIKNKSDT